jgi:nicotinamidase-related amidase
MKMRERPALLLIDIQKGFDQTEHWGGNRNNPAAEDNAAKLLTRWRQNKLPVYHVKHNSINPESLLFKGKPGNEIKEIVKPLPNEPVFEKTVNSAFIGTELKQQLDENDIRQLVIVGLTTDHCVSTSVRMAGNLGYDTIVVSDATATFDKEGVDGKKYTAELIHETALASLNGEFASVVSAKEVLNQFKDKGLE